MEFMFIFVLQKDIFLQLTDIEEIQIEWAGEFFSKEPKEYLWKGVRFSIGDAPKYINSIFPKQYKECEYVCLYPEFDKHIFIEGNYKIRILQRILSSEISTLDDWAIILDVIDEKITPYICYKNDNLLQLFDSAIKKNLSTSDNISGFIIYKC
ncbi:MAG: hypothetical protein RSA68_01060 [Hafnia sp.]|uniref:hypothetical protein n=1 Tax=Hafnia sp. TaxID=1873498 RepID=UPI002FC98AF1